MTPLSLNEAIKRLIIKRREAHGNDEEQKRINEKLTKLYDLKWLMLQQEFEIGGNYETIHNC